MTKSNRRPSSTRGAERKKRGDQGQQNEGKGLPRPPRVAVPFPSPLCYNLHGGISRGQGCDEGFVPIGIFPMEFGHGWLPRPQDALSNSHCRCGSLTSATRPGAAGVNPCLVARSALQICLGLTRTGKRDEGGGPVADATMPTPKASLDMAPCPPVSSLAEPVAGCSRCLAVCLSVCLSVCTSNVSIIS
jgi:hypothetical protein